MMRNILINVFCLIYIGTISAHAQENRISNKPLDIIFETDMGNDVDDVLALDMLYKYADQGIIELLAVSTNKDNKYSSVFLDILNTWNGYPSIPIGVVENGANPEGNPHDFAETVVKFESQSQTIFKTNQKRQFTESVQMYRQILSKQEENSVVIISVGFSTNLARLISSPADNFSNLTGKELIRKKVKFLSMMAGNFNKVSTHEFNIVSDIPSAKKVLQYWPTKIIISPFDVGRSILFPAKTIENDLSWTEHHPLVIAYKSYLPMPYDRPTWDLSSVLYAVEKDSDYFFTGQPGTVVVNDSGYTSFKKNPNGNHRIIGVKQEQKKRVLARYIELITIKPKIYN